MALKWEKKGCNIQVNSVYKLWYLYDRKKYYNIQVNDV